MSFIEILAALRLMDTHVWDLNWNMKVWNATRYTYTNKLQYTYPRVCGYRGLRDIDDAN